MSRYANLSVEINTIQLRMADLSGLSIYVKRDSYEKHSF